MTTKTAKAPKGIVETQRAAAKRLGVTTKTLRAWRAEGAPGFEADGSINLLKLSVWKAERNLARGGTSDLKDEKTLEEIRKLKLANDQKEGRLIERSWMAERIHAAAGMIDGHRLKSEAEHPPLFAAAEGDVAKCREIVRKIWDDIALALNGMKEAFKTK